MVTRGAPRSQAGALHGQARLVTKRTVSRRAASVSDLASTVALRLEPDGAAAPTVTTTRTFWVAPVPGELGVVGVRLEGGAVGHREGATVVERSVQPAAVEEVTKMV